MSQETEELSGLQKRQLNFYNNPSYKWLTEEVDDGRGEITFIYDPIEDRDRVFSINNGILSVTTVRGALSNTNHYHLESLMHLLDVEKEIDDFIHVCRYRDHLIIEIDARLSHLSEHYMFISKDQPLSRMIIRSKHEGNISERYKKIIFDPTTITTNTAYVSISGLELNVLDQRILYRRDELTDSIYPDITTDVFNNGIEELYLNARMVEYGLPFLIQNTIYSEGFDFDKSNFDSVLLDLKEEREDGLRSVRVISPIKTTTGITFTINKDRETITTSLPEGKVIENDVSDFLTILKLGKISFDHIELVKRVNETLVIILDAEKVK